MAEDVKAAAPAAYRDLKPPEGDADPMRLAAAGESVTLEYKSSLRSPTDGTPCSRELAAKLEAVIVKTVAGFLNGQEGTLLVGVDDAGRAVGLEADYASSPKIGDRDGFERHLRDLFDRTVGMDLAAGIAVSFGLLDGRNVCRIIVSAVPREVLVPVPDKSGQPQEVFYLRTGNQTQQLKGQALLRYVRERWAAGQG